MVVNMCVCSYCQTEFTPRRTNQKHCTVTCGNNIRAQTWRAQGKEKLKRQTPSGRYYVHKVNAGRRKIPFDLTFEEWWSLWEPHWSEDNYGKLCMCRTKDEGHYSVDNVRIDTWQNNYREARGMDLV